MSCLTRVRTYKIYLTNEISDLLKYLIKKVFRDFGYLLKKKICIFVKYEQQTNISLILKYRLKMQFFYIIKLY